MDNKITFENGIATFSVNELGEVENQTYMGKFKVRCVLTPLEFIEADHKYRELLGRDHPDLAHERTRTLAFALSQLMARVIEKPPWWQNPGLDGAHIKDDNIILYVLDMAIEAEEKYRDNIRVEIEKKQEFLTKAIEKGRIVKDPELQDKNEGDDLDDAPEVDLD